MQLLSFLSATTVVLNFVVRFNRKIIITINITIIIIIIIIIIIVVVVVVVVITVKPL